MTIRMHSSVTLVTLRAHQHIFLFFISNSEKKKVKDLQGLEMGISKF